MKRSTKAVLLSALVFPGLGHLYLRRWAPGIVLSSVAAYAVYTIASVTMRIATDVIQKIESGGMAADLDAITRMVTEQASGSAQATNLATLAFAACWLMGIVGSFLHGRAQDTARAEGGVR